MAAAKAAGLIAGNLTSEYIKSRNFERAVPLGAARWKRTELHLESYWLEILNVYMNTRDYENGYSKSNARNFDAVQKILEEGLEKYPDNKSLKKILWIYRKSRIISNLMALGLA